MSRRAAPRVATVLLATAVVVLGLAAAGAIYVVQAQAGVTIRSVASLAGLVLARARVRRCAGTLWRGPGHLPSHAQ